MQYGDTGSEGGEALRLLEKLLPRRPSGPITPPVTSRSFARARSVRAHTQAHTCLESLLRKHTLSSKPAALPCHLVERSFCHSPLWLHARTSVSLSRSL